MAKKIFLGLAVCLWMLLGTHAWAVDYEYSESGGEITITKYIGTGGDVVIPDTIDGMPVVSITGYWEEACISIRGEWYCENYYYGAFEDCAALTSVTIGSSVTSIGESAFARCDNLTSVTIPDSVISIEREAFRWCYALASVTIGNNVISIGYSAFGYCDNLASVTIGNSVTSVGTGAFEYCSSLTSVIIPDSVTDIESGAFSYCSSLTTVTIGNGLESIGRGGDVFKSCGSLSAIIVDENNLFYSSFDGVLYNKDKAVLVRCPSMKFGEFIIPNSVTSINHGAFSACDNLTSVTIPDSVTVIGFAAFEYCSSLTSVIIPDSVTTIESYAFRSCSSLTSVIISDSVTDIESDVFCDCTSLTSINIPDSVTSISLRAFGYCHNLTSVIIPDSVAYIGPFAFYRCSSLSTAYFLGDAPSMAAGVFDDTAPDFQVCYTAEATGFTTPTWYGYPAADCACLYDTDCEEGYSCVDGQCVDAPPVLDLGPFLAAGPWPVLPTESENPMILTQDYNVLWTFSDDYASCPEFCTHTAQYQAVGDSSWTELSVDTDPTEEWYAYVDLPIEDDNQMQNATTYALRFTITDCAEQSTESAEYYFRVATEDAPPVIEAGPFLAAGFWPLLPRGESGAFVLTKNYNVLWTFSDDYASCEDGLCTHRARYKDVNSGDWVWTWLTPDTDPTGEWYAYVTLPVDSLAAGTYMFHFDVTDCIGQITKAPRVYYFTVE